jgi:hypothetical protein
VVIEVVISSFTEKKNARRFSATGRFDSRFIEREKGFEPSTSTLARRLWPTA